MSDNIFFVFSDESGTWHTGDYYIRSWVRIHKIICKTMYQKVKELKNQSGINELKWKNIKQNIDKLKDVFNFDFKFFITISIPAHLVNRKFKIVDAIEGLEESQFTGKEKLPSLLKQKAINTVRHLIFVYVYERQHVQNAKDAFDCNKCFFVVDKPQCLEKEWKDIGENIVGIERLKIIKKSENEPGIELADIITGCVHDVLNEDERAIEIFNRYLKSNKMCRNPKFPNPNVIFYKDFQEFDKEVLEKIKRLFR